MVPPGSQIGPISEAQRASLLQKSPLAGRYDETVDRESAYEKLAARGENESLVGKTSNVASGGGAIAGSSDDGILGGLLNMGKEALFGRTGPRGGQYDGLVQSVVKSEARRIGRNLLRGALGSLIGGRRR